jgi:hypothetical protein
MEQTNAAQQEPWWEDFTQSYGKESLRALAKRFGTNPRRLRRAAQRCGLTNEPPELLAAAERLGTCPDDSLAADIGVTPELIKGARLRRKIEAFNPKTLPKPRVRKPKKAKPPRPERPVRERYNRSEPVVPTVVVKRTRSRIDPERGASRVDEGAQKLANTLGRIRSEEAPAPKAPDEGETSRRRRVVSPERNEEMRGLKPSSLPPITEGDGRTTRRRMPRVGARKLTPRSDGGDDEPGGSRNSALAAARISKALSRAAEHTKPEAPELQASPRRELSKPPSPPRFVPEPLPEAAPAQESATPPAHPSVEDLLEEVELAMSPVASLVETVQESMSPLASLASSLAESIERPSAPVRRRPLASTTPESAEMLLWTAEYTNAEGVQLSVISAPTFLSALERAKGLGELISVREAPSL